MEGNQFDDVGVVEPQIDPKRKSAKKKKQKYDAKKKKRKPAKCC